MTPVWFPWIVIGGILFTLFGFIGTKYKDKDYRPIQSLQDFISGGIMIAFMGVLIPDIFPAMEWPSLSLPMSGGGTDDLDLQVGPPRLIRA